MEAVSGAGVLSYHQIIGLLEVGDFSGILGQREGEWLEFKASPYVLTEESQKLELAKDVSALANAGGGVILLGFVTEKDETHGADAARKVRPIPAVHFDADQYRDVIARWTWPQLTNIVIRCHPERGRASHVVVSIEVPACDSSAKPILICRMLLDDGKQSGIVFGYCERRQASVTHLDRERLHSLIARGIQNSEIAERLDGIETLLAKGMAGPPASIPFHPSNIEGRLAEAIEAAKLNDYPQLVLIAHSDRPADMRELFSARNSALVKLIEHPPELRYAGFDITPQHSSEIVRGLLRRSFYPERMILEVHSDGLVLFVNRGDHEGLCWNSQGAQKTTNRINSLFLAENAFLFATFVQSVFAQRVSADAMISYRLSLNNVCTPTRECVLISGPLGQWLYGSQKSSDNPYIAVHSASAVTEAPGRVAFNLLSRLYAFFGFEAENVPYVTVDAELGASIDPALIIADGK